MVQMERIERKLMDAAGYGCVLAMEPMKDHTSFRIGGPATLFVTPESEEAGKRRMMRILKRTILIGIDIRTIRTITSRLRSWQRRLRRPEHFIRG